MEGVGRVFRGAGVVVLVGLVGLNATQSWREEEGRERGEVGRNWRGGGCVDFAFGAAFGDMSILHWDVAEVEDETGRGQLGRAMYISS